MDKKQTPRKRNQYTHAHKTGAQRPSDGVSGAKFIQYPGTAADATGGYAHKGRAKKLKKPEHTEDTQRKSRKIQRKQKTRSRLLTFILVAILLAICLFISLKVLFIVHQVEAQGSERYTPEEIVAFCAIPMEENIFKIETEAIEAALVENFTYVEKADVRRKLPDKILITITDSIPTFYSRSKEGELFAYTIYSQNFKHLTVQASLPQGLMRISADLENRETRRILLEILDTVKTKGYENITAVEVAQTGNISLVYQDRITIQLGTMLDIEYKLKMAMHVIQNELSATDKGIVDAKQAGSAIFRQDIG